MTDIINEVKKYGNELLSAEVRSAVKLSKLKHNKKDLETLLANSISEIEFLPKGSKEFRRIICSSNVRFVNVYKALKPEDKTKKLKSRFIGIHTIDPRSVDTYDLVNGKLKTINLDSWRAVNFVMLTEDNVVVLDKLVKECLKR